MAATMTRWTPFRELESMQQRMRRMLGEVGIPATYLPAADIYETPAELVVELEVPGYVEKELGIEVTDHVLTVKGEREEVTEKAEKTFRLHERLERHFERSFELPAEADTKQVRAVFGKGVLEVHVPKLVRETPHKVEIGTK